MPKTEKLLYDSAKCHERSTNVSEKTVVHTIQIINTAKLNPCYGCGMPFLSEKTVLLKQKMF